MSRAAASLYVYGLAGRRPRSAGRGLAREGLRVLNERGFVVIAGEMEEAPAPEPHALRAHDAVVRRLARACPAFLPARFGWLTRAPDLRAALGPHRRDIEKALAEVRGCVQMTVRLFGDTAAEPPLGRPTPRRRAPAPGRAGTAYLQGRARAWREAESLPELDPLRPHLAGLLRAERQERHGAAGLVGTAYHLVERGRLRTYRARVRRGAAMLAPLRLQLSGPWAPYAFGPRSLA